MGWVIRDSLPYQESLTEQIEVLCEPYPDGLFKTDGSYLPKMSHLTPLIPVISAPYPEGLFSVKLGEFPSMMNVRDVVPVLTQPYPDGMYQQIPGKLPKYSYLESVKMGAFLNSTKLTSVNLPSTLTNISEYSFAGTNIAIVSLPVGCVYYATSFPNMCEIKFMGGDNS